MLAEVGSDHAESAVAESLVCSGSSTGMEAAAPSPPSPQASLSSAGWQRAGDITTVSTTPPSECDAGTASPPPAVGDSSLCSGDETTAPPAETAAAPSVLPASSTASSRGTDGVVARLASATPPPKAVATAAAAADVDAMGDCNAALLRVNVGADDTDEDGQLDDVLVHHANDDDDGGGLRSPALSLVAVSTPSTFGSENGTRRARSAAAVTAALVGTAGWDETHFNSSLCLLRGVGKGGAGPPPLTAVPVARTNRGGGAGDGSAAAALLSLRNLPVTYRCLLPVVNPGADEVAGDWRGSPRQHESPIATSPLRRTHAGVSLWHGATGGSRPADYAR